MQLWPFVIHKMQASGCHHFESQKTYTGKTEIIPMAPDGSVGEATLKL